VPAAATPPTAHLPPRALAIFAAASAAAAAAAAATARLPEAACVPLSGAATALARVINRAARLSGSPLEDDVRAVAAVWAVLTAACTAALAPLGDAALALCRGSPTAPHVATATPSATDQVARAVLQFALTPATAPLPDWLPAWHAVFPPGPWSAFLAHTRRWLAVALRGVDVEPMAWLLAAARAGTLPAPTVTALLHAGSHDAASRHVLHPARHHAAIAVAVAHLPAAVVRDRPAAAASAAAGRAGARDADGDVDMLSASMSQLAVHPTPASSTSAAPRGLAVALLTAPTRFSVPASPPRDHPADAIDRDVEQFDAQATADFFAASQPAGGDDDAIMVLPGCDLGDPPGSHSDAGAAGDGGT